MVQTPQQRKSNLKFANKIENRMGKPTTPQTGLKTKNAGGLRISPLLLGLIGFALFGSIFFELVSRWFFS